MPIAALPPAVLLILQSIQAAITLAPGVVDVATKGKDLISSLFAAGVITKDQQDALHLQVDAIAAMVAAGITPPHWQVEPDPV